MSPAELRLLPVNLRNRFGREVLEEIEAMDMNRRRDDDEIDEAIATAEAHVPVGEIRARAHLN